MRIDILAFQYWAGVGRQEDLESWVAGELHNDAPHPKACSLLSTKEYEEQELALLEIAYERCGFEPVSELGGKWAKNLLLHYCQRLLQGNMKPHQFCEFVNMLEVKIIDGPLFGKNTGYYPEWLFSVVNDCDWCDKSWTTANSPHLAEAAWKLLADET